MFGWRTPRSRRLHGSRSVDLVSLPRARRALHADRKKRKTKEKLTLRLDPKGVNRGEKREGWREHGEKPGAGRKKTGTGAVSRSGAEMPRHQPPAVAPETRDQDVLGRLCGVLRARTRGDAPHPPTSRGTSRRRSGAEMPQRRCRTTSRGVLVSGASGSQRGHPEAGSAGRRLRRAPRQQAPRTSRGSEAAESRGPLGLFLSAAEGCLFRSQTIPPRVACRGAGYSSKWSAG